MTPSLTAIAPIGSAPPVDQLLPNAVTTSPPLSITNMSFGQLMTAGINQVEAKVTHADQLANAFTLDDSIPVHQVTFALEDARLSLELMMQVRSRLVETYQQLMGMQL